jgi:hypothetical protein
VDSESNAATSHRKSKKFDLETQAICILWKNPHAQRVKWGNHHDGPIVSIDSSLCVTR